METEEKNSDQPTTPFRAGFVNIVGKPNVGKSTLMNALVGERLSIITHKAQTTRHRIMGIVNGHDFQIVYSDTPGIIEKPAYKMQESMMRFVQTSLTDADVVLVVTDITDKKDDLQVYADRLAEVDAPILLLINKTDLSTKEQIEQKKKQWQLFLPRAELFTVSALKNVNLDVVLNRVIALLPLHPPYYEEDDILTDRTERFFVTEIIREKILLNYHEEIPYSVEVMVDEFKEEEKITRIRATIYTNRQTQKSILIGKGGSMLKKVGTEARLDIEAFLQTKVFLELFVKVRENWRNDERFLKGMGYE